MKRLPILFVFTVMLCACGSQPERPDKDKFSGYFAGVYYEKLTRVDMLSGQVVYRYIAPEFKASNYHSVLIDPVITYPKPKPADQVNESKLKTLENKMTKLISSSFGQVVSLAQSTGEGVARMETVISSVSYATGARDQEVDLYLESKFTDSLTDEVLALAVRQIPGEDLEDASSSLEAQKLSEGLEKAGTDFVTELKIIFHD